MYPFNIVSYGLFIFFVVIYFAYNGIIDELDELRELTKWSWLVWTLYYGYMATCGDRFKHVTLVVSMFVAAMGLIVTNGVSILFFLHAAVILNGISLIGIGGVYVINLGSTFYRQLCIYSIRITMPVFLMDMIILYIGIV